MAVCMVVCVARFTNVALVIYVPAIMSIPPLLSSTPPPLEENGSVLDHDDDFGEFSDRVSIGAVYSSTSVVDDSSVFLPTETAKLSDNLYLHDTKLKPDSLQEDDDEWSEFDTAVVQSSLESTHTNSVDVVRDEQLSDDTPVSEIAYAGNPPVCISHEGSTEELSSVSLSTSQMMVSEQLNLEDVFSGSCTDIEGKHDDETLNCEEHTSGQFDHDLRENVITVPEDADPQYEVEEIEQTVDEDEDSFSAGDNRDLEFDDVVETVMQDSEDYNGFHMSSRVAVSDRNDHVFTSNNQSASDEKDFTDDFQSFSDDVETYHDMVEEVQLDVSNSEDSASVSDKEQEARTCIETSSADSTSCKIDSSSYAVTKDDEIMPQEDEIMSTDPQSTHEQVLVSDTEADDDFDDFEEFVAAKEGPVEHQPVVDSHWNAFENTDADDSGGDWAAFQDFDQPVLMSSRTELSESDIASIERPVVPYTGQLSKVHNV